MQKYVQKNHLFLGGEKTWKGMSEELEKRKLEIINMLLILIVFMVSCMYTNVKNDQIVHFKCVQFVICR